MVGVRSIFEILCVVLLFSGATVGLISLFLMNASSSYLTTITGYSLIVTGISLLFGFMLHNIYMKNKIGNTLNGKMNWLQQIIISTLPFILMALNLSYLIFILSANKSIVTSGNLSNDYNIFSKIFIILTIIQTSMIYYGINAPDSNGIIPPIYNALLVLISIVNLYIIRIIKIVIVDYPVDCVVNLCNNTSTPSSTSTSTTASSSS
jgi:hypothetical protein